MELTKSDPNNLIPMVLPPDKQKEIEDLAALNYAPEKIALILDVDEHLFLQAFYDPSSEIRRRYDRGILIAQADIEKKNLRMARDGNTFSMNNWKKQNEQQRLENYKKELQMTSVRREYEDLQALVEKGEVRNLTEKQLRYFEQIDFIRALYNKWKGKDYIISSVQLKWPAISRRTATELFYESIQFFNQDNDVKVEQWSNVYADRFDQMGLLALEMNDLETARRCFKDAAEMRGVGKEKPYQIPAELLDRRPIFHTTNIKVFGIAPADRTEIAEFIDSLPITGMEKARARRDAMIEEAVVIFDEDDAKA